MLHPPFSPYTSTERGSLSQYSIGWNAHLRGETRETLPNDWQKQGWDAAWEYVQDFDVPVPCPEEFVRYPYEA